MPDEADRVKMNSDEIIAGIREIHAAHPVPAHLQRHMFRVAAVGRYIADNWRGPAVNSADLVAYLLLHDIGNIVKFGFEDQDFHESDVVTDLPGWKQRRDRTIALYGDDDHLATMKMAEALKVPRRILQLLERNHYLEIEATLNRNDWEQKIGKYADLRVAPHGVVSLSERFAEARRRYASSIEPATIDALSKSATVLERQVFTYCTLRPQDIMDPSIAKYVGSFQEGRT